MNFGGSVGTLSVFVIAASSGLLACNKTPSAAEATPAGASAAAPIAAVAAPSISAALTLPPLSGGLDPCLVGSWRSKSFSLTTDQATAEGGANAALKIAATGDAIVDFGPMAPINGKGAGVNFDFQYAGKATAKLSTPSRGALASSKSDYAGLRVTASAQIPNAGKISLFKNKPVSELAQMVAGVAGAKAAPGAPPPGLDSSPIFSTTRYTCADGTLTLESSDQLAAKWIFARTAD
jgi:hypothetical protein